MGVCDKIDTSRVSVDCKTWTGVWVLEWSPATSVSSDFQLRGGSQSILATIWRKLNERLESCKERDEGREAGGDSCVGAQWWGQQWARSPPGLQAGPGRAGPGWARSRLQSLQSSAQWSVSDMADTEIPRITPGQVKLAAMGMWREHQWSSVQGLKLLNEGVIVKLLFWGVVCRMVVECELVSVPAPARREVVTSAGCGRGH